MCIRDSAISDALLGALALGDIGKHFPNTDPKYKDIDSKIFLRESYAPVSYTHLDVYKRQEKLFYFYNSNKTFK